MTKRSTAELYQQYVDRMQRVADLRYAAAVLQWDQETYLPPAGAPARGRQLTTLGEAVHQAFTDPALGSLLEELAARGDLAEGEERNVRVSLEDYQKQTRFSAVFVRTMTEAVHRCFHSWLEARNKNSFLIFQDELARLVQLKREEAHLLGFKQHPYDALLNEHDKGLSVAKLDQLWSDLRKPLQALLQRIGNRKQVNDDFLKKHYPRDQQWAFSLKLLGDLGFDFNAGRQDISEHPFTINFNSRDVRITTRIDESDLANMTYSCMHEVGHALYEQGLPENGYGLPAGEAASFSIHESQSRLWENHVGRSPAFCERYFPIARGYFPEQLSGISTEMFYQAVNKVQPSLIRTEADEVSYHFHIMIRYEIEKGLLDGRFRVKDIPAYWNDHYREYLGLTVPDDRRGCLQDVHWSHGSFGYFPSYSLGSIYAAQIYQTAGRDLGNLDDLIRNGSFRPLLNWLQNKVYAAGRLWNSEDLCLKISGLGLSTGPAMQYWLDKYQTIYHI